MLAFYVSLAVLMIILCLIIIFIVFVNLKDKKVEKEVEAKRLSNLSKIKYTKIVPNAEKTLSDYVKFLIVYKNDEKEIISVSIYSQLYIEYSLLIKKHT